MPSFRVLGNLRVVWCASSMLMTGARDSVASLRSSAQPESKFCIYGRAMVACSYSPILDNFVSTLE